MHRRFHHKVTPFKRGGLRHAVRGQKFKGRRKIGATVSRAECYYDAERTVTRPINSAISHRKKGARWTLNATQPTRPSSYPKISNNYTFTSRAWQGERTGRASKRSIYRCIGHTASIWASFRNRKYPGLSKDQSLGQACHPRKQALHPSPGNVYPDR